MYASSRSNSFALSVWPKALAAEMTVHRISARRTIPQERSWNAIWRLSSLSMIRGKDDVNMAMSQACAVYSFKQQWKTNGQRLLLTVSITDDTVACED